MALERIIRRAGLQPWPKLFHNMRATRETELAESFPLHVVCAWIGNSSTIAANYLQVTDEHFDRAMAGNGTGPDKAARNPAQNPAQQPHAGYRNGSQGHGPKTENPAFCGAFQEIGEFNSEVQRPAVGGRPRRGSDS